MKILTVVVPSYNTEKYIDECVSTFISEKSINDIEILLISDGSTDNTLEKLESYKVKYPESIKVIDKENGGHGSVVNRGIKEARGKFIKIIDGDDWVVTESFNKLVDVLKTIDTDLVLNPYITHNIVTGIEKEVGQARLESKEYIFDEVTDELPLLALHGITYKTELLRKNNISFQEKCFYDDAEYYIYPVPYIETITYLDFPVYVYRIGSLTQSVNPKNAIRNRDMLSTIVENLILFHSNLSHGVSKSKMKYITKQVCHIIQNMYGIYLKMPIGKESFKDIYEFDQKIKGRSKTLYAASGSVAIKALRLNIYPIYVLGCKLFEKRRKKRGF